MQQHLYEALQYRLPLRVERERERRTQINWCLDKLSELVVDAPAQTNGQNAANPGTSDVLELTVRLLRELHRQRPATGVDDEFRIGYTRCAIEMSLYLAATPEINISLSTDLMSHVGRKLRTFDPLFRCSSSASRSSQSSTGSASSYPTPLVTPSYSSYANSDFDNGLPRAAHESPKSFAPWRPW